MSKDFLLKTNSSWYLQERGNMCERSWVLGKFVVPGENLIEHLTEGTMTSTLTDGAHYIYLRTQTELKIQNILRKENHCLTSTQAGKYDVDF